MPRPEILAKPKSLLLKPILAGDAGAGSPDELIKSVGEPVRYSWPAFAIFIFLIAVAFVTAGRALALA
ncbi:MAG: hypothetical protein ACLPWS_17225 [Rhodomicrobium sp.]